MKRLTARWIRKAEADLAIAAALREDPRPFHDGVCFHCQQSAEKYLKALMKELGLSVVRTHDLTLLLNDLAPHDRTLEKFRRSLRTLSRFAVNYRYPGANEAGGGRCPADRAAPT